MLASREHVAGFTLMELVLTMVVVGIIASIGSSRWFERRTFDTRGYADEVAAMLRYAQKSAVGKRRQVCVTVGTGNVTLRFAANAGAACDLENLANNADLAGPTGQTPFRRNAPNGVTLAPAGTFTFDPLGRPGAAQALTVTGDFVRTIRVEAETGYVH